MPFSPAGVPGIWQRHDLQTASLAASNAETAGLDGMQGKRRVTTARSMLPRSGVSSP